MFDRKFIELSNKIADAIKNVNEIRETIGYKQKEMEYLVERYERAVEELEQAHEEFANYTKEEELV